ncbi:uncharacterized protein LOC122231387 isoform X1 [Panthera tigris]|uniref:uncharacterized protein LOC122231387 isoform X1 n=1 Tax=Panthera tigris TaxID=9694 RepID=UPI001C6F8D80|nr:uncharacterized protein LOC122231387 isoform X1 [Panthera tigris]
MQNSILLARKEVRSQRVTDRLEHMCLSASNGAVEPISKAALPLHVPNNCSTSSPAHGIVNSRILLDTAFEVPDEPVFVPCSHVFKATTFLVASLLGVKLLHWHIFQPWMCCPSFLPSRTQRTLPHKDQWPDCALSQAQTLSRCPSTSTVSGITLWVHHSRLKKANSEEPSTWRSDPDPVNPLKLTLKKTLAPEISSPAPATPRKLAGLRMEEV